MTHRHMTIALCVLAISLSSGCTPDIPKVPGATEGAAADEATPKAPAVPAVDPSAPGEDPSPPVPQPATPASSAAAAAAAVATGKVAARQAASAAEAGADPAAAARPLPPSAVAPPPPKEPVEDSRGRLVTDPAKGSPEWVIQQVLIAAMTPDAEAGWRVIEPLMHNMHRTPKGMQSYRAFNYPASRRKVHLFLGDDSKPHYRVSRVETPEEGVMKIFVYNEKSMPTPCAVKKDDKAGGAWRVYRCSL